jgi:hypothetical protein
MPFVYGRLSREVEILDCLDDRKARLLDLALTGTVPQIVPNDDAQIDDKEKHHHVVNKGNRHLVG